MSVAGGRNKAVAMLRGLWQQSGQQMDTTISQVVYDALQNYSIPILAKSLAKAVKYTGGKRKPANYIKAILDEQSGKDTTKAI